MKTYRIFILFFCMFALSGASWEKYDAKIIKDIVILIEAAGGHSRAFEWSGACTHEVDKVAKYGLMIAPLLVDLLNHPKTPDGTEWSIDEYIGYDQQIQLALCKIFNEKPAVGNNVYGVRESEKNNLKVKAYWEMKAQAVSKNTKEVQPGTQGDGKKHAAP